MVRWLSGPTAKIGSTNRAGGAGDTYSWQVGSFGSRDNAERTADTVRDRFDTVRVVEAQVKGSTYYRVRVGEFTSKKAA